MCLVACVYVGAVVVVAVVVVLDVVMLEVVGGNLSRLVYRVFFFK